MTVAMYLGHPHSCATRRLTARSPAPGPVLGAGHITDTDTALVEELAGPRQRPGLSDPRLPPAQWELCWAAAQHPTRLGEPGALKPTSRTQGAASLAKSQAWTCRVHELVSEPLDQNTECFHRPGQFLSSHQGPAAVTVHTAVSVRLRLLAGCTVRTRVIVGLELPVTERHRTWSPTCPGGLCPLPPGTNLGWELLGIFPCPCPSRTPIVH